MSLEKSEIENIKEKILQNDDYMKWLEKFTNRYPSFYEYDWVLTGCTKEDEQNIKQIGFLYEVVEEYAEANYFNATATKQGIYYQIKYNGVSYKVGFTSSSSKFYCERTEPMKMAIDFRYIQRNIKHSHAYFIESELYHIANSINRLMKLGMESENIKEELEATVDKCKTQESNKKKVKTPKNN